MAIKKQANITNWALMVRADDVDVARANWQLKQSIAAGATGVAIVFEGSHNAYAYGLPARPDAIKRLFDGIELKGLHLRLDNHPHGAAISNQFVEFLQHHPIDPQRTKITFGIDPTASLATCGKLKMSIAALKASQPQSMSAFFAAGLPGIILEADGRPYHNAGANRAQELAAMLCIADEHLDMVEAGRHPIVYALPHIGFATALDSDFNASLVKLRVLRRLWSRLQEMRGIKERLPAPIHVETSRRMLVPHNIALNNARNHYAALAAIVGGAVSLSVLPPNTPLGLPDHHARHDTLMSQLVLAYENADLDKIAPSPEAEMEELSQRAWAQYQAFKSAGGVMACLLDGSLARQLAETHERCLARTSKFLEQSASSPSPAMTNIYDEQPLSVKIDGLVHCQPLIPIHSL